MASSTSPTNTSCAAVGWPVSDRVFSLLGQSDEPDPRQAPLCLRPVATLTAKARALDSYGGVTAELKRAIEVQPAVEDGSSQVMIDGYCTWWATRLLGVLFGRA